MKEEEKQSKKTLPMKGKGSQMAKKRWVYPAVYLSFAAVILTSVLWYQNDAKNTKEKTPESAFESDNNAVPVSLSKEQFQMPVADPENVSVVKDFYNDDATAAEKEAALVVYNNIYYMNRGIDLATEKNEAFDVTAALSGNVVKAGKDPELGFIVEIEHAKGVITHYSSLASIDVKEGDAVKQGDVLGKAGQNVYDKDAKIHAHFEVRKDGQPIDPISVWKQSVNEVAASYEQAVEKQKKQVEQEQKAADKAAEEQKKADDQKADDKKADDKKEDGSKDQGKDSKDKDANAEKESSTETSETE
ncbi:peptidoglycan DD-metalloendopeptidase family protein [Fictibacillus iocasae]|uniref:Peptidoglycan DD-metalloendopeptidase family protein n=1 Tax=Fictibacillus iocasae TaxID=2715437 RepID=A0ABW2NRA2_9BACL